MILTARGLVNGIMGGPLSRLETLYRRHDGEECYIFGNGVSLKWMDLSLFRDKLSIASNFLIYHNQFSSLKAPYCPVVEPYFFWPLFPYAVGGRKTLIRHHLHEECLRSMEGNSEVTFFVNISNYPVVRLPNVCFVSRSYVPGFSEKNPFLNSSVPYYGTLSFQLYLAIFMGFKKAYLVGHDYTHSVPRAYHFYEKGTGVLEAPKSYDQRFLDYIRGNIDLSTVVIEGGSDIFPAVTYKELTGAVPRFRDNCELVPLYKLRNLATWKGYDVF